MIQYGSKSWSKPLVVILHNEITKESPEDVIDNYTQAVWIAEELKEMQYKVLTLPFQLSSIETIHRHFVENPNLKVVNLVDSEPNHKDLVFRVARILETYRLPFSGCSSASLELTTHKVQTKLLLEARGVRTSPWIAEEDWTRFIPNQKYIVKATSEDASIGLQDDSVLLVHSQVELQERMKSIEEKTSLDLFAEHFIEGREFNVCIFGPKDNPTVLPPYEWVFEGFEQRHKEKIINYDAKWTENTFEYEHVKESYDFVDTDANLVEELQKMALQCWEICGLNGLGRIDFRVDRWGTVWVLEVNANPSFYGFHNIARKWGLNFKDILLAMLEVRDE